MSHRARGGDADRHVRAGGHRNGGGDRQRIDDPRIAQADRVGIDDRDAVASAVRQAAGVAEEITAVGQDVAVPELVRRTERDRVVCVAHDRGDVEGRVVLQLDAELVDHRHLILRAVDQAAPVACQRGVVGDDVAVGEGMARLQLDGELVHHHHPVALARHKAAGVRVLVAGVGDEVAVGKLMFRSEGQRIGAGIEIDVTVQRQCKASPGRERTGPARPVVRRAGEIDRRPEGDRVRVGIEVLAAVERHRCAAADGQRIGAAVPHRTFGLQLDVEGVRHHDGVLRAVDQTARVADLIGAVGDGVAIRERVAGLQSNLECVHDDDAVLRARHEIARGGSRVAVIGHDVALGEPVRRGEAQRIGDGIERDGGVRARHQLGLGALAGRQRVRAGGPIRCREIDRGAQCDEIRGGVHRHVTVEGHAPKRIRATAPGVSRLQLDHLIGLPQVGIAPRAIDDQRVAAAVPRP